MKRVLFFLAILAALASALPVQAREQRVYVPTDETKSGNFYAVGETVEVAGSVESDLIVAAGNVVVTGPVGGDVIAVGGNVRIVGPVGGNVRVFGGRVELAGLVERNVTAAAGELTFAPGSEVRGHVTAAAGTIEMRGSMDKGLLAAAGQATAAGSIAGPVTLWLDKQGILEVRETAIFGQGVIYYSDNEAIVTPGATFAEAPQRQPLPMPKGRESGHWFGRLVSLFGALVLAMVLMKLAPQLLSRTTEAVVKKPLPSFGFGALWLVAAPVAAVILVVTLIGLPLAILLALIYASGFILSPVVAGAASAELLRQPALTQTFLGKLSPFAAVAIGVVVYKLVTFIPFLGGIVGFVGLVLALGAMVYAAFRRQPLTTYEVQS